MISRQVECKKGGQMTLQALATPTFIRKTTLAANEYRKNFRQLDCAAIAVVTSPAAKKVTGLMSHIYLNLVNAPVEWWEREGVLHFTGEVQGETVITAWENLIKTTGVADKTLSKAVKWLHMQGVIGYFAAKNGVGIRIFLNRAANSIGTRPDQVAPRNEAETPFLPARINQTGGQKILSFPAIANGTARTSLNEAGFRSNLENLESEDKNPAHEAVTSEWGNAPSAPDAGESQSENFIPQRPDVHPLTPVQVGGDTSTAVSENEDEVVLKEAKANNLGTLGEQIQALQTTIAQLGESLREELQTAAQYARQGALNAARIKQEAVAEAGQAARRTVAEALHNEAERNRNWWENKALPKAIRVAQRECYDLLRKEGGLTDQAGKLQAALQVGRQEKQEPGGPPPTNSQTAEEIRLLAEICATLHQTQGQSLTKLAGQLCATDGSPIGPADSRRIAALAQELVEGREALGNPFLLAAK
jgi:hypothetical protein